MLALEGRSPARSPGCQRTREREEREREERSDESRAAQFPRSPLPRVAARFRTRSVIESCLCRALAFANTRFLNERKG